MAGAMLLRASDYECALLKDELPGQIPSAAREVYEIICVCEGGAEYWIEDRFYKLTSGDILLIPVGVMVSANLKKRGCPFARCSAWMSRRFMTFLKLQDDAADTAFEQAHESGNYLFTPAKEDFAVIKALFEEIEAKCSGNLINNELMAKSLLSEIIAVVNRTVQKMPLLEGTENRLAPVLTTIHAECTKAITVESLAERFGYSASHLAHSFKKQMGTSLYHYVLLRRLQIGREAMLEGVPVKEAYQKCGFGDYAGFYRAFIKEFGMSPQQYKKKNT